MLRHVIVGASWIAAIGVFALTAPAQETVDWPVEPAPTAVQRELVQQLGALKFRAREEAAKKLASLGVAAKEALQEGLKDPDLEVRTRARWILLHVLQDEFEARLTAFVADIDGKKQYSLPGWKRFQSLLGAGREVREMFAEMMRSDQPLLAAYEQQSAELPELFASRVAWLLSNGPNGGSDTRFVPLQTVATLLLIGSDAASKTHSRSASQLYQLLSHPVTMQTITSQPHPSRHLVLLEKWTTAAAAKGSSYGMMLALKYDLREAGLQQANELIHQATMSPSMLQYAIITIGKYGGEEHLPLLTPLLQNKTVCHRWSNPALKKDGAIDVQVRDVALVVLLRITGKAPGQFGFKLLRENPETLYHVYTFGFVDEEEREAAHAKWAEAAKADEN